MAKERDRAGRMELLTGLEGVSSQPVRRIVLVGRRRPLRASAPWL